MNITKHYSNGEVTIVWQPELCTHSTNCWRGLPSVFKPKEKPWITETGATSDIIIAQIAKCPSGALTTFPNRQNPNDNDR